MNVKPTLLLFLCTTSSFGIALKWSKCSKSFSITHYLRIYSSSYEQLAFSFHIEKFCQLTQKFFSIIFSAVSLQGTRSIQTVDANMNRKPFNMDLY